MTRKVLIVEDHPEHREYLVNIFRALGFLTVPATRADEVLHLAEAEQPDLVLLDIRLPGGDGRTVARQLKETPATAHIPILAVTGIALSDGREKLLAAGCDEYLPKPFTPQALREKIDDILERPGPAAQEPAHPAPSPARRWFGG
jgi:two-component system cell cycle response regulator DivK